MDVFLYYALRSLILILLAQRINVTSLNEVWMQNIALGLSDDLVRLKNEELGYDFIKNLYTTFKYRITSIDANHTVNEIAHKLEAKINNIFSVLSEAKYQILNSTSKSTFINGTRNSSVNSDFWSLEQILCKLKTSLQHSAKPYFLSPANLKSPSYFGCNEVDHNLVFNNYLSRNKYIRKNIILLLDHGGSLSKKHFMLAIAVAKEGIKSLNDHDRIVLFAISNEWTSPKLTEDCLTQIQMTPNPQLTSVNASIKNIMYKFLDGLDTGSEATNHSLALQKAFEIIQKNRDETFMILYITRGQLSSLAEVETDLTFIRDISRNLTCQFLINTCAIIDDNRPTIYETQFLQDLASQNYEKYNISKHNKIIKGTMIPVNTSEIIGFALSQFYKIFNPKDEFDLEKKISLPIWDEKAHNLAISFSVGFVKSHNLNLLGVNIDFTLWAEDLINFSNKFKDYYAFLIDVTGKVIIHPKFASLTRINQQLKFVDISNFEKVPLFHFVRNRFLKENEGYQLTKQFGIPIRWSWKRIANKFIVCVVSRDYNTFPKPFSINWPFDLSKNITIPFVFQRFENFNTCRHLNQIATLDASSIYLSTSCFESPSLQKELTDEDSIRRYMTYLQHNSDFFKNPGLKPEIKDEVVSLAHIINFLKNQHMTSLNSKYIVRRYVASFSGVLQMFPGSFLNDGFDPTSRSWFVQAVEHRNKLIMIPPYLDEGGAGYIITMAYATEYLVVAIDITYGYIFRLLIKKMPFCFSGNITCFLMDDRGYLIYHPNLIEVNENGPIEKQHIIHKESLVANDILSHTLFIKKMLCNSYGGDTVQRYYKLNTSYNDVLVSKVQGDQCVSYHIAALHSTNIFVGIVNATCNIVITFCPCSIVDRLCLNCNRMEQKECECPCECPLEQSKCADYDNTNNEICKWFPEHTSVKPYFSKNDPQNIKSCFPLTCGKEKTHLRCLGITGCEWCKFDVDGVLLQNPFCASMPICFNGVVGSLSPYPNFQDSNDKESYHVPISVITILLFCIFLLVCMLYIYHRTTLVSTSDRLYFSSTQENHLRMSDLNLSDNFHSLENHRDKLLPEDKSNPISPYCVSNNYKPNVLTAESDHGYSTMTQHDESEHMSLAPIELQSLEGDLASENLSINTRTWNKLTNQFDTSPYTFLPKNKRIVVPVIVHRNMETV